LTYDAGLETTDQSSAVLYDMGDVDEDVEVDVEEDAGVQESQYDMGAEQDMDEEAVSFGFDEPEAVTTAALVATESSNEAAGELYGNTDDMLAGLDEQAGMPYRLGIAFSHF
jgi:hypothetical protein